jgi:hypothetical protein
VPLSRLNRSQHSTTTTTVQAMGNDKNFGWVELGEGGDGASRRGVLGDEESAMREGIFKTDTITVTVESDGRSDTKARSFLGIG